ncbi:tyrosine-protein phosphatase 10D-like [Branchiostoma floridae]|uniref:protein-tyrosine-phosphatase n=1 Tax=Branchiostoma floridae TaxID=7739 RepID=A0A9J7HU44_BRAFL|nr:tyrosine-protein phosphatase 10D-like [Branchiostoma floridae]
MLYITALQMLDPGQSYSLSVVTVSAGVEIGPSQLSQNVVTIPEVPTNLTALPSQTTTSSIDVSWDVEGVAEQFLITATCYHANCVNETTTFSWNDCQGDTGATIDGLTPGAFYSLTVAARSGGKDSAASIAVMEQTEPVPPTNVTFDLVNVTSLMVMWTAAEGVHDGYNLSCSSCEGRQGLPLFVPESESRYQYDGLIRGQMYNFSIITVSEPKYSQPTEITQIIDPAPVENITILTVSSRNVSLGWQAPEGVYSHFIITVTSDSGEDMMVKSDNLNATLVDLTPGTSYTFTVYTVSGNKESEGMPYGPEMTLEEPPGPVSNLTLVDTSSTTLQVSWQPPEEPNGVITSYTIRVRNSADIQWNGTVTLVPAVPTTVMMTTTAAQPMDTSTALPPYTVQTVAVTTSQAVTATNTATTIPGTTNVAYTTVAVSTDSQTATNPTAMDASSTVAPQTTPGPTNMPSTSPMVTDMPEMTGGSTALPSTLATTQVASLATTTATMGVPFNPSPTPTNAPTACFDELIVVICGDGSGTYPPDAAMLECDVSGLVPHREYFVEVFASTAPGAGDKENRSRSTLQDRPCDPPTDVDVYNTSSSSSDPNIKTVNITWTPPTQPNGNVLYTVYMTDSSNMTTTINTTTATAQLVVDNLDSFSTYTITVAAFTAVGYGPESDEVMFMTEEGVPSTSITDLQANVSATTASLQWTPPSEPNGIILLYEVHINDTTDHNYTVVNTTGPDPSIVLEGLEEYWGYMVWIYTYTRMGIGQVYSDPYTILTEEAVPGSPPISGTIPTSTSIAVEWGPPSKYEQNGIILGYYLSYNTASADPTILSFNSSVRSYSVPGLTPYTNYTLCLWAWNSAGNGSRSCLTEETRQDLPSAPLNLAVREIDPRSITLKWDSPTEANGIILGYTIMYTMEGESDAQEVNTSNTTGQILELRAYTEYSIQVAARTVIGQGDKSEVLEVTTTIAKPDKPLEVQGIAFNQSSIKVDWEEPDRYAGPTSYIVQVYNAETDTLHITLQAGDMTSWTVSGLNAYTSYYFVVVAMTEAGNTSSDQSAVVTTLPGVPVAVSGVKPEEGSSSASESTTLTITFTSNMFSEENGPVESYTVFVAEDTDVLDAPSSGHENDTTVRTWYDVQNRDPIPPYQVTDKQPYPFTGNSRSKRQTAQSEEFTIGTEDCEPRNKRFCNGPLKPGTTYRAKLRAFTQNGWYADSDYSGPLKTAGPTVSDAQQQMYITIGASAAAGVVGLCLIILIAVVCLKQRRNRRQEMAVVPPQALLDIHLPASEQQMVETSSRPIYKSDFVEHMEKMSSENQYWLEDEYSSLRHVGRDQRITAAHLSVNSSKNRYTNILPYDHSRVELHPLEEDENSDYINANYIPGYRFEREFIATQGPVPFTVPDFWRMVWEQNSRVIVMLTQCWERGKAKCERYWPEDEEPVFYGDIVVKMLSENKEDDWTCREFELANNSHSRCVRQYQFTSWPDHGVPEDTKASLEFVRMVRRNIGEGAGPAVIHCSAGVGRTGTFITLDRLMQHMEDHDHVDIFGIVHQMRLYRVFMVQTQEQYIFIHQCIMDLLQESTPAKRRSTIKRVQFAEDGDEEIDLDDIHFSESTEYLVSPDANSAL